MPSEIIPNYVSEQLTDMAMPSGNALWMIFAVIVFLYSLISFILAYHWRTYGFDILKMKLIMRLYFSVSGILLAGMTVFLFVYQLW